MTRSICTRYRIQISHPVVLVAIAIGLIGCSDFTYGRTVKGKVTSIGDRLTTDINGGKQQKIALQLNPFEADSTVRDTAGGADGLAVECVSTRCSSLKEGQCVELECSFERRTWEPNVIECKMVKTIECGTIK